MISILLKVIFSYRILVLIFLYPAYIGTFVCFNCLKLLIWCVLRIQYGKNKCRYMPSGDAVFQVNCKIPFSPLIIPIYFGENSGADLQFLRNCMKKVFQKNSSGICDTNLWKLQSVPLRRFGYYFWLQKSETIDINFHVRQLDGLPSDMLGEISDAELQVHVERLMNKRFTSGKPQWEFLYVPKVRIQNSDKEDKVVPVFVFRLSHSYMDAIYFMKNLLFRFTDMENAFGKLSNVPETTSFQKFIQSIIGCSATFDFSKYYLRNHPLRNINLTGKRLAALSKPIKISTIKAIINVHKIKFSSVLLKGISDAFKYKFREHHIELPEDIAVCVTCPTKISEKTEMDFQNQVGMLTIAVPITESTATNHLTTIDSAMRQMQNSPAGFALPFEMGLLNLVTDFLTAFATNRVPPGEVWFSNMTYPKTFMWKDKEIVKMRPWGAIGGRIGIMLDCVQQDDELEILLTADKAVFKDHSEAEAFLKALHTSIATMAEPDV